MTEWLRHPHKMVIPGRGVVVPVVVVVVVVVVVGVVGEVGVVGSGVMGVVVLVQFLQTSGGHVVPSSGPVQLWQM